MCVFFCFCESSAYQYRKTKFTNICCKKVVFQKIWWNCVPYVTCERPSNGNHIFSMIHVNFRSFFYYRKVFSMIFKILKIKTNSPPMSWDRTPIFHIPGHWQFDHLY